MLEGLEISEISLNQCANLDYGYRLDAEFYNKEYIILENYIAKYRNEKLAAITAKIDVGYVGSMTSEYSDDKESVILLQTKNIDEFFVNTNDVKRINRAFHNILRKSQINYEDILIARSGSFGKASIYLNQDIINSADIIIVSANKNYVNPYYLVSYLNSRYGKNQLYRFASGGLQGHVNLTILEQLQVVILSDKLQSNIEQLLYEAHNKAELATKCFSHSELILLESLGLNDLDVEQGTISSKRYSDFIGSGRLDAEYYQPKYDKLFAKLEGFETKRLGNIVHIDKSIEPGSEAYQNSGIPFIRVANLSKYGITDTDIFISPDDYADAIRPKRDTILLSKDGSVGIAYKVEQDMNVITSGAILHLTVTDKEFMPDYLTLVLNSVVVGMQAERDAGGSVIQHWKPSEIKNVIIPKLSIEIQQEITDKVRESFALRKESMRLLELAKTAVEVAIEQGETAAMEFITANKCH